LVLEYATTTQREKREGKKTSSKRESLKTGLKNQTVQYNDRIKGGMSMESPRHERGTGEKEKVPLGGAGRRKRC